MGQKQKRKINIIMKMCLTTGNKNQQPIMRMLSNQLTDKNRNNNSNDFSMSQFSENINQNGVVFPDENNISNHNMNNYHERDLTQSGIMKPSKYARNSTTRNITSSSHVNGFHQVNAFNQADQQNELNLIMSNTTNNRNTMATTRSSTKAISLPSSHISRTQSELQLCKDIAAAEWHDNCMFDRLVKGMREKQQARRLQRRNRSSNYSPFDTADMTTDINSDRRIERSLESIVRHRCEHMPYVTSSPFEDDYGFIMDSSYGSSGSNIIEPDDDEDQLVFDMDDL